MSQKEIAAELNVSQSTVSRLKQETPRIHLRNAMLAKLYSIRNAVPFPLYCSEPRMPGRIMFANQKLAEFLNYSAADLIGEEFLAENIFALASDRIKWVKTMLESRGRITSQRVTYQRRSNSSGGAGETIHVVDTAMILRNDSEERDDSEELVVGILGYDNDWAEAVLAENRVAAYRQILELINSGVHELDAEGRIIFMNRAEQSLLEVEREWLENRPYVCELSPASHPAKQIRVDLKLRDGVNLTKGEHRSFRKRPQEPLSAASGGPPELVPVHIYDIPVAEPDRSRHHRMNREIFTLVQEERIAEVLTRMFKDFGPRNPLLEEAGVSTFIGVEPDYAEKELGIKLELPESARKTKALVFIYANRNFSSELMHLTRRYPKIGVSRPEDILGKTQEQLWDLPEDDEKYGLVYASVDRGVIQEGREDERIEEHVSSRHPGKTNVQVIKLPYYSRNEPGKIVGVQGFYWEVGDKNIRGVQATILHKLERIYRPFDMLNTIPVPVLRKDLQLRFIYGNKAYIEDLGKISTTLFRVTSLHDIIGKTDQQVFPMLIAKGYEADDFEIITGRKPEIRKTEQHGDGYVEVVKSPVYDGPKVVGVQAIFWPAPQNRSRPGR